MSHPNKAKGTRFESEVVAYLSEWWPAVERRALHGTADKGDLINGPPGWTLELKNEARINLAGYVDEARQEAANAGTEHFAAVVKRRGKGAPHAYVVLPLAAFVRVLTKPGEVFTGPPEKGA